MATTIHKDIRDAIKNRIVANWTQTPIQWANTTFKPPLDALWIQPRLIFHGGVAAALGPSAPNFRIGDLHCNIISPIGKGDDEIGVLVDAWCELFRRGYLLATATKTITFEVPDAREPIETEDDYEIPVICPFFVYEAQP
jgi:hypothetical protein